MKSDIKTVCQIVLFTVSISLGLNAQKSTVADSLLKAIEMTPPDSTRVILLFDYIGKIQNTDTSLINLCLKKIERELENNDVTISANWLYKIGIQYETGMTDLGKAIKYYELAIKEAKKANNPDWIIYESWLGYTLLKTGDNEKALFYLLKATEEAENKKLINYLPRTYLLLGYGFRATNNFDKFALFCQKSIDASLKINDSTDLLTALNEIGNIYYLKNDINNALLYHKKVLEIRKNKNDPGDLAYSYHDIASDYLLIDSVETALSYMKKSKYYAGLTQNQYLIFFTNAGIFDVQMQLGLFKEAEMSLSTMQNLAGILNLKNTFYQLYHSYYAYYRYKGEFEKALKNYELATQYNDSISNEEIEKNIQELDKKYETAKKDKELIENQEHIKRQQIIILFSVIVSGIVAFFLILVNIQFRQKREANTKLEFQNQEILKQKEELQTLAENLQIINVQLVEQRNEIIRQREKLFELNATKDKFFSIMAHDLKNPFNSLLGMSELLLMNASVLTPEKVQKYARTMNTSSKQAYSLLENLLEWSRIQTGKLIPKLSKTKPSALINEVKMLLEAAAQTKNINLISEITDDDQIVADPEMTKTVLRNLITNALKFTFDGGTVLVECQKIDHEILFSITDTGTGIEPEHLNKLFRIDCKLSRNGTADEKGTGLGLILCKEFIEKQSGNIWAESEIGKGSCFKFTIPISHREGHQNQENKES